LSPGRVAKRAQNEFAGQDVEAILLELALLRPAQDAVLRNL